MPTTPTNVFETPSVEQFRKYAEQITETYKRKNADYGDSFGISVKKYGLIAALTRMSDKFNRAENLILNSDGHRVEVTDESLSDTLLDLAAYCIMTCMQLTKKIEDENE